MPFSPESITREHVLDAVKRFEREQTTLRSATRYEVEVNGKNYPPKEVMRYAHAEMNGELIWELNGGNATNKFLERMGFEVRNRRGNGDPIPAVIQQYKQLIRNSELEDELYKWRLVEKYKGRPNVDAENIESEVLDVKYGNLIYQITPGVIKHLLRERPEEYREALRGLFDEEQSIEIRVVTFQQEVLRIYREIEAKMGTHHDERTIAAMLTVKYPDRYTFYKDSFYRKFCELLGVEHRKSGGKFVHYLDMVEDFINDYVSEDSELLELVGSFMTDDCYADVSHKILAQDILFQILDKTANASREQSNTNSGGQRYWLYAPGENASKWQEFYDKGIAAIGWDELGDLTQYDSIAALRAQLQKLEGTDSSKANDSKANFEFSRIMKPGDIIIPKKGRTTYLGYGVVKSAYVYDENGGEYPNIRYVDWKKKGEWRDELGDIVLKTLTDITDFETKDPHYSTYVERLRDLIGIEKESDAPINTRYEGPLNQILYGPPGTGKTYRTVDKAVEICDGTRSSNHQENKKRFDELRKNGQIEFVTFHQSYGYEDFVVGISPDVTSGNLRFDRREGIFKQVADRATQNWMSASAALDATPDFNRVFSAFFSPLIQEEVKEIEIPLTRPGYNFKITNLDVENGRIKEFVKQSGGKGHDLLVKNIKAIYEGELDYGTEGLGIYYYALDRKLKEFAATLAQPAIRQDLKNYVLIIDEINRANISRVFGELITLLEDDKRLGQVNELKVTLPNGDRGFGVPPNLYVVGTMNTADKSIALIDIALRRRFEFEGCYPQIEQLDDRAANLLRHLNESIYDQKKSPDYLIGHAYFMKGEPTARVLERNVIPLLIEYFSGKTNIICDLFKGSGWNVSYDASRWTWEIAEDVNASL